eukprot:UN08435
MLQRIFDDTFVKLNNNFYDTIISFVFKSEINLRKRIKQLRDTFLITGKLDPPEQNENEKHINKYPMELRFMFELSKSWSINTDKLENSMGGLKIFTDDIMDKNYVLP